MWRVGAGGWNATVRRQDADDNVADDDDDDRARVTPAAARGVVARAATRRHGRDIMREAITCPALGMEKGGAACGLGGHLSRSLARTCVQSQLEREKGSRKLPIAR